MSEDVLWGAVFDHLAYYASQTKVALMKPSFAIKASALLFSRPAACSPRAAPARSLYSHSIVAAATACVTDVLSGYECAPNACQN